MGVIIFYVASAVLMAACVVLCLASRKFKKRNKESTKLLDATIIVEVVTIGMYLAILVLKILKA